MTRPVPLTTARPETPSARPPVPAEAAKKSTSDFAVRASKTIAASATSTFAAWTDSRRRARWLVDVKLTIHRAVAPKFVGLRCEDDGTDIAVVITAKGRSRCVVAVEHTKLASAQLVAERRHCWKEMLRNLAHYVAERA